MLYPPTRARTILDMRWQVAVTLLDVGLSLGWAVGLERLVQRK